LTRWLGIHVKRALEGGPFTSKNAVTLVVAVVTAAVVTWVATSKLRSPNEAPLPDGRLGALAATGSLPSAPIKSDSPSESAPPSVSAPSQPAVASAPRDTSAASTKPSTLSLDAPPLVDAAGPVDQDVTLAGTKIPPIKASDPDVARSLLSSTRLHCRFGDGVGGVANGDTFKLTPGNSTYAAGPGTFEVLDLSAGKAQMTGDAGAASSPTGVSAMRVTPSENALSFSGISPLGEIIVTTIYATKSPTGRFTAVQSRHGLREPHIGAQFYGSCEGDGER
jgi:hypothetical protein